MDTTSVVDELPARPRAVVVGAALLLGSAVALLVTWTLGIDAVESNGARVFFVVLWGFLAWSAYHGAGWVRGATVAVFLVAVWGLANAPSFEGAVQALPTGDVVAKAFALVALVSLWSPAARHWYGLARELRLREGE